MGWDGDPQPGWLTWMGWGSMPSWLQRSARGRPKRAPAPAEPNGPGASTAAKVHGRANGQGSLLLLLWVPPTAEGNRAKSHGGEAPGECSQSPSVLSPRHRGHGRGGIIWDRGAPELSSLLPQSDGDGHALREGQQQPHRSTRACLQEQERKAILPQSSPHSPSMWPCPPSVPEGTGTGSCLAPACKKWAALTSRTPQQKGPLVSCISPWLCVGGGDG